MTIIEVHRLEYKTKHSEFQVMYTLYNQTQITRPIRISSYMFSYIEIGLECLENDGLTGRLQGQHLVSLKLGRYMMTLFP